MSDLTTTPAPDETSQPVSELLQELPPYVARGIFYLLGLLFLSGLIYSTIGRLDEVVTTRASVVPRGFVRPVQAATGGRVTRVAVQEGDLVARDQAIVYLEADAAQAQL